MYSVFIDAHGQLGPDGSQKSTVWLGGYDKKFINDALPELRANFDDMEWFTSLYGRNNFAVMLERIQIFEMEDGESNDSVVAM